MGAWLPHGAPFSLSWLRHAFIHSFTLVKGHLLCESSRTKGWAKQIIFAFRSFQSSRGRRYAKHTINFALIVPKIREQRSHKGQGLSGGSDGCSEISRVRRSQVRKGFHLSTFCSLSGLSTYLSLGAASTTQAHCSSCLALRPYSTLGSPA